MINRSQSKGDTGCVTGFGLCFAYAAFREATVQTVLNITFLLKVLFGNYIEISVTYWYSILVFI